MRCIFLSAVWFLYKKILRIANFEKISAAVLATISISSLFLRRAQVIVFLRQGGTRFHDTLAPDMPSQVKYK